MNRVHRITIQLIASCLILGAGTQARAEEIDIPYTLATLDNGLTVIVHEDRKVPIVAVNIWYHVGSKNERPGRTGFAHLFEHLMFQGSENYDDEYLLFMQQLGATDLNATTWFDRTNYFETVPKNALDTVLWLESDRMGHFSGAITQDKLDEQRGVVQNEKRQGDNQPYGKVWERLLKQVFPANHPYSWETIGSMEDLDAATLDDVKDWFATYYGPNNAVLVIAGDVDADEAIAKVEHYFGDIPPGPPLIKPDNWIPAHAVERREVMQDRVPQARLYKVWSGPRWGMKEATQLSLATRILGGGKNSRLYERLVYDEQIATDVELDALQLEISGITYLVASAHPGAGLSEIEAGADAVLSPNLSERARPPRNSNASRPRHARNSCAASNRSADIGVKPAPWRATWSTAGHPIFINSGLPISRRRRARTFARWPGNGSVPARSSWKSIPTRNSRPAPKARIVRRRRRRVSAPPNVVEVMTYGAPIAAAASLRRLRLVDRLWLIDQPPLT